MESDSQKAKEFAKSLQLSYKVGRKYLASWAHVARGGTLDKTDIIVETSKRVNVELVEVR